MSRVDESKREEYLNWQSKEISKLREENYQIKRTIKAFLTIAKFEVPPEIDLAVPEDRKESWTDRDKRLNALNGPICRIVTDLTTATCNSVHYDVIDRTMAGRYRDLYSAFHDIHGTITARCRELRKQGYLMTPPGEEARFVPGPKLRKGEWPT